MEFPPHFECALGSILLNQLVGLLYFYYYKGNYIRIPLGDLMFAPYSRVLILQLVTIIGGIAMSVMELHLVGLVIFVVIKTVADFGGLYLSREQ